MPEALDIPERCRECPLLVGVKNEFDQLEIDPQARLGAIEEYFRREEDLSETDRQEQLSDEAKILGEDLTDAESKQALIRDRVRLATGRCLGPLVLRGRDRLGRGVMVEICGSLVWRGSVTDENTRVHRPGLPSE